MFANKCQTQFATRLRGNSATRFPVKSAPRFPAKCALRSLNRRRRRRAWTSPGTFAPKWRGRSATTYPGKFASRWRTKYAMMYPASNARSNVPTHLLVRSARLKTPTEPQPPIQFPLATLPESSDSFSSCHTTVFSPHHLPSLNYLFIVYK